MIPKNSQYSLKVNGFTFLISDGDIEKADLIPTTSHTYSLINEYHSINAKITGENLTTKEVSVEIDGEEFLVVISDELDIMLDQMGFHKVTEKQIKDIKAPMPGLVLEITVTEGQDVAEGEKVIILGAMKMENSIMVIASAKIKRIKVKQGEAVEKGQVLMELE